MYSSPGFSNYQRMYGQSFPGIFSRSSPSLDYFKANPRHIFIYKYISIYKSQGFLYFPLLTTIHNHSLMTASNTKAAFRFPWFCLSFTSSYLLYLNLVPDGVHTLHLVDTSLRFLLIYRFSLSLFLQFSFSCIFYCHR